MVAALSLWDAGDAAHLVDRNAFIDESAFRLAEGQSVSLSVCAPTERPGDFLGAVDLTQGHAGWVSR